ncbi:hypothetical protein [Fulvivirga ligni]|uniref:hypothetical protein n=1 Tax=Fulvivirga ligni TaxID=2904246 RepID=UPI001F22A5C0|nr:hypothetical protein [Fulvivirga ligni]UII20560.1 hypothetical protein LVD16_22220 [Fulvivirga ligni]
MEKESDSIFGFFASFGMNDPNKELVKSILWGNDGIDNKLKNLKYSDYGTDFKLILFQIYSNPISYLRDFLKPLENYRRKEKSIGIPLILDDDNFFNFDEQQQRQFLNQSVLDKLNLLGERVKKSKLDLNVSTLSNDVKDKLKSWKQAI